MRASVKGGGESELLSHRGHQQGPADEGDQAEADGHELSGPDPGRVRLHPVRTELLRGGRLPHSVLAVLIEDLRPFIEFPKLFEDLVTDVVDRVLRSPLGHLVYELNHKFEPPNQSGENEKFQY